MKFVPWLVTLASVVVVGVMGSCWQADRRDLVLEARNARAERDTSVSAVRTLRTAEGEVVRRVTSRLAEEHRIALDDLTRQLVTERRSRVALDARVAVLRQELQRVNPVIVTMDSGTAVVRDSVDLTDSMGVAAAVEVRVARGDSGTWGAGTVAWRVYRIPFTMTAVLTCEQVNARLVLEGPPWLPTTVDRVQVDDRVCLLPSGWHPFRLEVPSLPTAFVLVVVGYLVGKL